MSETASTIIKLLSALVSPKSSVKLLSVAISLIFSWVYLGKYIESLKESGVSISNQQSDIIILLVGVGVGGFLGFFVIYIFDMVMGKWASFQKEKSLEIEIENSRRTQKQEGESFLEGFKLAIDHLLPSQVRTLRQLTKGRCNIDFSESDNRKLSDNKYIQRISCAYGTTYITQINPLINIYVTEHWEKDIESRIECLYNDNIYAKELLNLLMVKNSNSSSPVDTKFFKYLSAYGDACLHGDYERYPSIEDEPNYELWLGENDGDVMKALEQRNKTQYNGNLIINHDRLIPHDE